MHVQSVSNVLAISYSYTWVRRQKCSPFQWTSRSREVPLKAISGRQSKVFFEDSQNPNRKHKTNSLMATKITLTYLLLMNVTLNVGT